jgi:glycosyltransferase involved in cell wall biosynthesis
MLKVQRLLKICILSAFEDSMLKDTGASVRIYNLSRYLASKGNTVELIIPKHTEACESIEGVTVHSLKGLLPRRLLEAISRLIGVSRPTTLFFYDPLFIQRASLVIRMSDIVQFEQQSAGALLIPIVAKFFRKPVVIDCHDTFQALRVKNTNSLRKFFETFLEKMVYRFASLILTVSDKEKQFLFSLGIDRDNIAVIPNGVDTKAFNKSIDTAKIRELYSLTGHRVVVFVGNMEYSPNREAVRLLSSEIAPMVEHAIKDVKFLIVGRLSGQMYTNLSFTGTVDTVAPILVASDVAVAPLLNGSGTRLKILEYFSCSLPVISTTVGMEGLEIRNGVHALVEDDMNLFASKLIQLLNDKKLSRQLGQSARALVVNSYDWSIVAGCLNKAYQHLLYGS